MYPGKDIQHIRKTFETEPTTNYIVVTLPTTNRRKTLAEALRQHGYPVFKETRNMIIVGRPYS